MLNRMISEFKHSLMQIGQGPDEIDRWPTSRHCTFVVFSG